MNRIFIFAVAVITLTLTACGNKTQGGGDNDSLQTDSLQANDATKHTEEYIRQRIDTIYKYCGGKAVQIKGKICDRSRFTTTRFNKLCAEVDRLCNVIALRDRGYKDAIVVDMGTATTFDVMKNGGFAGGIIIPGISASLDVLTEKAARLMPVSIEWPDHVIANNTDDAIRAGLLYGFMAELESLVEKIKAEMGRKKVPVFATGGWGQMVMGHSKVIDTYDPYLTLNGVRLVALRGNGATEIVRDSDDD